MKIAKTFATAEEYRNSEEIATIYKGYSLSDVDRFLKTFKFIKAYTVERDAETNYGRNFDLYIDYEVSEGVRMVRLVSLISIMSNQSLRLVMYDNNTDAVVSMNLNRYNVNDAIECVNKLNDIHKEMSEDFIDYPIVLTKEFIQ